VLTLTMDNVQDTRDPTLERVLGLVRQSSQRNWLVNRFGPLDQLVAGRDWTLTSYCPGVPQSHVGRCCGPRGPRKWLTNIKGKNIRHPNDGSFRDS
jgi:hypothetical protein